AAEDHGTHIGLEGHVVVTLSSAEIMREVIDAVGSPAVACDLDPVNWLRLESVYRSGEAIDHMVRVLGPGRILNAHSTDVVLLAAAGDGPAYVLPTAAARQRPELAVATARRWFADLGRQVEELPVLTRSDGLSASLAGLARHGRFFYLVGGDPGLIAQVLNRT